MSDIAGSPGNGGGNDSAPSGTITINPGDGGGNDAALINAALADPNITTVILGAGVFLINTPILIPSSKTLLGQGTDLTTIKAAPDFARIPGTGDGVVNALPGTHNVTLTDFSVDASKIMPAGDRLHGVYMQKTVDFAITRVDVYNATGYAHFAKGDQDAYYHGDPNPLYSSGTYEDCNTYNSQTHFEQMFCDGVTLTNVHAWDGDGDVKSETHFHPLAGSRNITYINATSYSVGHGGFNIAALDLVGPIENITIINADVEVWVGPAISTLGWLPTNGLHVSDSRFVSHTNVGMNVGGTTGDVVRTEILGAVVGTLVGKSGNGTSSDMTFTDTHTIGFGDPTVNGGANGIAIQGGQVQFFGGIAEARGAPGTMGPSNVTLNQVGTQLIKNGYEAIARYTENGVPVALAPAANLAAFGAAGLAGGSLSAHLEFRGTPNDQLGILDQGPAGISVTGSQVLFAGIEIGTLSGGALGGDLTVTFNEAATPLAVQALIRAISYSNVSDNPVTLTRTIDLLVFDSAGAKFEVNVAVAVTGVNDLPVLSLQGALLAYTEDDAPTPLAPTATLTDPDSRDFSGGSVMVGFSAAGSADDRLTVLHQGKAAGQIGVTGTAISYGGITIGTLSGGTDGATPLVVSLNASATPTAVQALLRAIAYSNVSNTPSMEPRTIVFTVNDGDGGGVSTGSLTVTVAETDDAGINEAPVIAPPTQAVTSFTEGGDPAPLLQGIVVSDIDAPASFAGGGFALTVAGAGAIELSGNAAFRAATGEDGTTTLVYVQVDGDGVETATPLAVIAGLGTGAVTVTAFTEAATPDLVNALLADFVYSDPSDDPVPGERLVTLVFDDGGNIGTGGALTATVTQKIDILPVNDAPSLDLNGAADGTEAAADFAENATALRIAPSATLFDADSRDFDGGHLVVAFTGGSSAEDRLSILPEGNLPGQIGLSGSDVTFAGVVIGQFSGGGDPSTPLDILLNDAADPAAVEALLRSIAYGHLSDAPSAAARTIAFTLSDGDGGTSAPALATVTIIPSDDAPTAANDVAVTTETGIVVINVAANDSDIDGPAPAVAMIGGQAVAAGQTVTLASGAKATLNTNGTISYNPNGVFNYLPGPSSGSSVKSALDSFTYGLVGGGTATVQVTVNGLSSAAGDLLPGTLGADNLSGGFGNERLEGGAGNDRLDGHAGNDVLVGGAGDDSYFVDEADIVIELNKEGFDSVYARGSYALAAASYVEVLATADYRSTAPIQMIGNEFNNAVYGNNGNNNLFGGAGDDSLRGLAGDDIMYGEAGRDQLYGGVGNDIYFVDVGDRVYELDGEGLDLVYALSDFALTPGAYVEVLLASDRNLTTPLLLIGNELDNVIRGNNGNNSLKGAAGLDSLYGFDGNDQIDGGEGRDFLVGGIGNDIYFVDELDQIVELAGEGSDAAYARTSYTLGAGVEVEILSAADYRLKDPLHLAGNELNNTISGNSGNNFLEGGAGADSLRGLDGDDILEGGAGRDLMYGGAGADTFRFTSASQSTWAALDTLADFQTGIDTIDLSGIDANSSTAGDDAFTLIGAGAFTKVAGQLRVTGNNGTWYVEGDVNGDGIADLAIIVTTGGPHLTSPDFHF